MPRGCWHAPEHVLSKLSLVGAKVHPSWDLPGPPISSSSMTLIQIWLHMIPHMIGLSQRPAILFILAWYTYLCVYCKLYKYENICIFYVHEHFTTYQYHERTSQSNINRITKLQKKAIRIISNVNSIDHTEPLFCNLNVLPFDTLITQGRLHLMHSIMNNYCPDSFLNIFQTNATRNNGRLLRNDSELILP
jgi:hypothetical protein